MKVRKNYLCILFVSSLCSLSVLGGCGQKPNNAGDVQVASDGSGAEDAAGGEEDADESGGGEEGADEVGSGGEGADEAGGAGAESLGEFSMEDINGESYTQEMFADYDLTMVNVFTTWCSPCINEIPDLQKLRDEMEGKGVNVVGIVLDAIGSDGKADQNTVKMAKELAERTGVSYPFLIPDAGYLNGRLTRINAVPETFFVDKEGNLVGETYTGSRSLEDWKSVVETELKGAAQ